MNIANEEFRGLISKYIEINDAEWSHFISMLQFKEVSKNEIIVSEGSVTENIYFVFKGALRTFFTNSNGEEKTFYFSVENSFAADYESFLKGSKSRYSIQALEDTSVAMISTAMLKDAYESLRYGDRLGRIFAEKYFFLWSDRIQDIYMLSPLERYNNMKFQFPDIFQRVPQHYIASYLNITPVHLSRLKKSVVI